MCESQYKQAELKYAAAWRSAPADVLRLLRSVWETQVLNMKVLTEMLKSSHGVLMASENKLSLKHSFSISPPTGRQDWLGKSNSNLCFWLLGHQPLTHLCTDPSFAQHHTCRITHTSPCYCWNLEMWCLHNLNTNRGDVFSRDTDSVRIWSSFVCFFRKGSFYSDFYSVSLKTNKMSPCVVHVSVHMCRCMCVCVDHSVPLLSNV